MVSTAPPAVFIIYAAVTIITVVANAAIAVADLRQADFVVANSTEVGAPLSWLPMLATLKAAAAAGLLAGPIGVALDLEVLICLGVAAGIGLFLLYTGALIAHLRARVFYNLYFPGGFWLLAIACLASLAAAS